jgi:hypothetical protein
MRAIKICGLFIIMMIIGIYGLLCLFGGADSIIMTILTKPFGGLLLIIAYGLNNQIQKFLHYPNH